MIFSILGVMKLRLETSAEGVHVGVVYDNLTERRSRISRSRARSIALETLGHMLKMVKTSEAPRIVLTIG